MNEVPVALESAFVPQPFSEEEERIEKPEFCPNPCCPYYERKLAARSEWYRPHGTFHTACRGTIKRFQCILCGKTCSTQTFSVHYWTHSTWSLSWLLQQLDSASGLRQIARTAGVSYRVAQNRIRHLARNCLVVMDALLATLTLGEDQAMDGFESYTRSQYHPNNITAVVGSESQVIYGAVHTLLRRKGQMTDGQKAMRRLIDAQWQPKRDGIKRDTQALLADLAAMIAEAAERRRPQTLFTDEHTAYPRALQAVAPLREAMAGGRFRHIQVSSRAARTVVNPLFPVNYVDRQLRKNAGEHVRETVKQGREVNCQMERYAAFMVAHNFLQPHRVHDHANPWAGPRHATFLGIEDPEVLRLLRRLPTHRHLFGHTRSGHEWIKRIWLHEYENPPAIRLENNGTVTAHSVALGPRELPHHFLA